MKDKVLNRVKAGIAYMNVIQPNWVKKINFRKFDIQSPRTCIVGSVFQDYFTGIEDMGLTEEASMNMGFSDPSSDDKEWKLLGEVWIREITKLKRKSVRKITK